MCECVVELFLQLLCISLVPLILSYSAQILLEHALFCRQNARLKIAYSGLSLLPAVVIWSRHATRFLPQARCMTIPHSGCERTLILPAEFIKA